MADQAGGAVGGAGMNADANAVHDAELVNGFVRFLEESDVQDIYRSRIEEMVEKGVYRLLVEMDHLRQFDAAMTSRLMRNPVPHIEAFRVALQQVALQEHTEKNLRDHKATFHVGFTGSFGSHHVSPRKLLSRYLGQLVCLEGIVTKMSDIRPKLVTSVSYCPDTGKSNRQTFRDWTNLDGLPTSSSRPKQDPEGRKLEMDYGHCLYKNTQSLTIQEMPERSPLGQLPRSVDVILDYDLVDSAKPGDRVVIVGLYRAKSKGGGGMGMDDGGSGRPGGIFDTKIIANSVQLLGGKESSNTSLTHTDLINIRSMAKLPDPFGILSRSLAPSIFGHAYIKQALLLLLLGGMEKNLENGAHLRGDINILMVGDPSTAKSQLLRFVLGIAPLAVSTTGRGSSGVGLTAAVTTDPETRERRLEAGAMVLADRGVVCIDEFDKMNDADRVAIHEVMEQQTVTIAKAGIHASLNARCSVLAAANPVYGQYDRSISPQRNVNLPDSLLSRFDLLFVVLDTMSADHDRKISQHILRLHRFERPGMEGKPFSVASGSGFSSAVLDDDEDDNSDATSPMYQKFNPLLHGGYADEHGKRDELLHPDFIRKYIHYAKSRIKPQLSAEACDFINQEYTRIRQEKGNQTLPITPRQLESFVRLATAHAKSRLSNVVQVEDAEAALKIMRFALYKDQAELSFEPIDEELSESENDDDDDDDDDNDDDDSSSRGNKRGKRKGSSKSKSKKDKQAKRQRLSSLESSSEEEEEEVNEEEEEMGSASSSDEEPEVDESSERFKRVQTVLKDVMRKKRVESINLQILLDTLKGETKADGSKSYSRREVEAILKLLETRNRLMYRDGEIMLV